MVSVLIPIPVDPVENCNAVIIPEVLALKLVERATVKLTLPVPLKDTGDAVNTSPLTEKSLAFCNAVAIPAPVA